MRMLHVSATSGYQANKSFALICIVICVRHSIEKENATENSSILKMNNRSNQYNIGPGPGVPIINTVPRIPTPEYTISRSMNIVNRSEIVAHPAKGTNNLNQVNNNQTNTSVYLHSVEKNQKESITNSNLNIDEEALDQLRDRLGEAVRIIDEVFAENGGAKEEVCEALLPDVEEIIEYLQRIAAIGRASAEVAVPSIEQNVVPSVGPTVIPSVVGATLSVAPIGRVTDYCHIHNKLQKMGKHCSECERYKSLSYCLDECGYCKKKAKNYERAEDRVDTNIYAQIIKMEKVKEMTPTTSPATTPVVEQVVRDLAQTTPTGVIKPGVFNRNGNFIDKYLAVTYTVADTDMTKDNRLYVERQLIENFSKLTQIKDMPCKGWMYVIEYTKGLVPHLHGIIRMSTELQKKKTIAATDPKFKGKNKIITNGRQEAREEKLKMLLKPINVEGWIAYMKKEGETKGNIEGIIEGWEYNPAGPMYPF